MSSNIEHYPSLRDGLKDPGKIVNELIEAGERWAELDAAASLLEDTKKTLLATLVNEYEDTLGGARGTKTKAESLALSDRRYKEHLEAATKAREEAHKARVKYDSGKIYVELQRSITATIRQEMAMGGRVT